jgi:hypothetical protein
VPLTNLDAPARNLQNIKQKHAGQPDKKGVARYRIHVSPWLVTAHFQKSMYMHDVLCTVTERIV